MAMKLNEAERRVLAHLAENSRAFYGDPLYSSFAAIGGQRKTTRRACRRLRKHGYAEFLAGLWTEDGEPAGAGYGCTEAGYELAKQEGLVE